MENGIGMVRRFVDGFEQRVGELEGLALPPQRFTLVTGVLGARFLDAMVQRLNRIPWISARVVPVVNRFLGEGITVSGLLSGAILSAHWPMSSAVRPFFCRPTV